MEILESQLNLHSAEFQANVAHNRMLVAELNKGQAVYYVHFVTPYSRYMTGFDVYEDPSRGNVQ